MIAELIWRRGVGEFVLESRGDLVHKLEFVGRHFLEICRLRNGGQTSVVIAFDQQSEDGRLGGPVRVLTKLDGRSLGENGLFIYGGKPDDVSMAELRKVIRAKEVAAATADALTDQREIA